MAGGDEAEPAFASDEAAIAHYRQRCSSLQSQLAAAEQDILEFTESSKELQAELESELERMDKAEKGMRKELDDTKNDKEEWKNKYTTALRDHTATITHMQRELETLRATEKSLRTKLRDMELDNDDLEKSEREKNSSLQDLETRYNKSIERIALLEEELVAKAQLEEEAQRLKDELRDVNEELVVTRSQAQATTEALKAAQASPEATSSTAPSSAPSSPPAKKAPSPVSTPRRTPSPEASPPPSIELVKPTPGPARGPSRQRRASTIASPPTSISPSKIARPPSSALPFPSPSPTGQTPFRAPLGRSTRTAHLHSYGLPSSPSSPALASPSRSRVASRSGSAAGGSFPGRAPGGLPRTDTATMIRDMQQMTSRVRQLTERLDQRRSNVMRGSAIPRFGSPSTANLAGLARGDGAESPTGGVRRSGLSGTSLNATLTSRRASSGMAPPPPRPSSRLGGGERDSTRPPSRSAALRASIASSMAASAASAGPSRPSSRLSNTSGASSGRPVTPVGYPARSATPTAGHPPRQHHQHLSHYSSRPDSSLSSASGGGTAPPPRPGSSLGRSTLARSTAANAGGHGRTGSVPLPTRSGRATPSYGDSGAEEDLRATVRHARRASGIGLGPGPGPGPGHGMASSSGMGGSLGRSALGRRASVAGGYASRGGGVGGGDGYEDGRRSAQGYRREEVPPVPPLPASSRQRAFAS